MLFDQQITLMQQITNELPKGNGNIDFETEPI